MLCSFTTTTASCNNVSDSISPDDIWAALLGEHEKRDEPWPPGPPPEPGGYGIIWSDCDACGTREPMLLTFLGNADWKTDMSHPKAFYDRLRRLRKRVGKRKIDLCEQCWEQFDLPPAPPKRKVPIGQSSLF